MPDFVKLPSEHVERLRLLSKHLDQPIADLVGDFIAERVAKGEIPDAVPGFGVSRDSDAIVIKVDDGAATRLSLVSAKSFASKIEQALAGRNAGEIDVDADWIVARVGVGIRLGTVTGGTKIVARGVAREIARHLERQAA